MGRKISQAVFTDNYDTVRIIEIILCSILLLYSDKKSFLKILHIKCEEITYKNNEIVPYNLFS